MKRKLLLPTVLILAIVALLAMGAATDRYIQWTASVKLECPWQQLGTITDSNDTLDVGDCTYSDVIALPDANQITWAIPQAADEIELRFQTDADADAHVVEIWVCASDYLRGDNTSEDVFTLGAILTLTGGKLVGTEGNVFVDTIAVTASNGIWISDDTVEDSATDRYAIWRTKTRGYKKMVIIATTYEAGTTLYCDGRYF